jgi:hypothetical protein
VRLFERQGYSNWQVQLPTYTTPPLLLRLKKHGNGALRLVRVCTMVKVSTTAPSAFATCSNRATLALCSTSRE